MKSTARWLVLRFGIVVWLMMALHLFRTFEKDWLLLKSSQWPQVPATVTGSDIVREPLYGLGGALHVLVGFSYEIAGKKYKEVQDFRFRWLFWEGQAINEAKMFQLYHGVGKNIQVNYAPEAPLTVYYHPNGATQFTLYSGLLKFVLFWVLYLVTIVTVLMPRSRFHRLNQPVAIANKETKDLNLPASQVEKMSKAFQNIGHKLKVPK